MTSGQGEEPYLNVRETAKLLGAHENTIRNWVKAGVLVSAKIPGARGHRFAREEVLRLQKERGATTAPVAPSLRTDGPELVTANDLNAWAPREDAKGTFPELMRRLLALTPGITNLDVRAHEGTAAPGWDGTATSKGSTYLPAGELRFEFGTDHNPKQKAQSDFDKRVLALPNDGETFFIFATPKNWPSGKAWARQKDTENKFAGVKVIDAHVLEGWLLHTPSVHYWISERLGYRPRDAQTIETWWSAFHDSTEPRLPHGFFLAGRSAEADLLRSLLTGADSEGLPISLQSSSDEETLAFIFAALKEESALLHRTVVVSDLQAWHRLSESTAPLILVPNFREQVSLNRAATRGHRIILLAGPGDIVRNVRHGIELPKVDRVAATEVLRSVAETAEREKRPSSKEVDEFVALARRSMPALLRRIVRGGIMRAPSWAKNHDHVAILAPLVLLGSWTKAPKDLEVVEKLTKQDPDKVERLLISLSGRADAPFTRSAGEWRLTSPEEAAQLLLPRLTGLDLARWRDVLNEALLEPDPFRGMDTVQRLTTSAGAGIGTVSETARKGLSRGLALAASSDVELAGIRPGEVVTPVVHALLNAANGDPTGEVWERLSQVLPLLAEASPDTFLMAVEADLRRPAPVLRTMFRDGQADESFGPSSPHPSLLWALETVCWSPLYFGTAADLLGQLATIDPGGRLSNRPLESLQKITLGWIRQSGGRGDDKIEVIRRLLRNNSEVGWNLLLSVWPTHHSSTLEPASPVYRDWMPAIHSVAITEWGKFVRDLVSLAVDAAGTSADRWKQLVPQLDELPATERKQMLETLRQIVTVATWSENERFSVWEALTAEADRHDEFSQAEWTLAPHEIAEFRAIAFHLEPTKDPRRFSFVFSFTPRIENFKRNDPGYATEIERLRVEALRETLAAGNEALEALITDVQMPHAIGHMMAAMAGVAEQHVLGWLDSDNPNLRLAASAFASTSIEQNGIPWLKSILSSAALQRSERAEALMGCVPFEKKFWDDISGWDGSLQAAYWKGVQVYRARPEERLEAARLLKEHGRPWEAVTTLANSLKEAGNLDVAALKEAVSGVLHSSQPIADRVMSGYYIRQLLEYLEKVAPEDPDLVLYEFTFFELLNDDHPFTALYRALGRDSKNFVEMVCALFRAEGEGPRTSSAQEKAYAHRAFSVLRSWRELPGQLRDGHIDPELLTEWVRSARLAFSDSGRSSIGDEQIGEVLAASPVGTDGVWPVEPVRDLIETIGSHRLETGLHIGKVNRRGVTSRGVFDGGEQERQLESHYREMADSISTKWPRTARVLRGIAEDYRREAQRNDDEAERLADDG
ncbi:helix-turn-helix domain-containing protein [Arthrobacter sp. C9C5]|uniref:helix-turn-helix domain-containing protein n=1 Tax=Arthrobacter sp. C9C5 TaxID=2735267 RepID=UPI001585A3EA|nr:helix-turn-helix domain-containing protein [Arthrobacter sp. C9C5]NUU32941.1 helix-turn-helix domain-containing protein [Arthrobacter sp. C9C5]